MNYKEVCIALDGKKYSEYSSSSEQYFKSTHKKNCINKEGVMRTRDLKQNGINYNECMNCKHRCINNSWHFEEDLIYENNSTTL